MDLERRLTAMSEDPKNPKWQMVCFWLSVAVVFILFVMPVETKILNEGGTAEVRITYTIWDKLTKDKPETELYVDGEKVRNH